MGPSGTNCSPWLYLLLFLVPLLKDSHCEDCPSFLSTFQNKGEDTAFEFEIKTPFLKVTKHSGHLDLLLGTLYKVYTFLLLLFLLQRSLKGNELIIALPRVVCWGRGNLLLCTTLQRSLSLFTHDILHNWNRTGNYFARMLE